MTDKSAVDKDKKKSFIKHYMLNIFFTPFLYTCEYTNPSLLFVPKGKKYCV